MRIFVFALVVIASPGSISSAFAEDRAVEIENEKEQTDFYAKLNALVLEGVDANDLRPTERGSKAEGQTLTQQVTQTTR